MYKVIMYDVYGTLFDPSSAGKAVREAFPEKEAEVASLWRRKQLDYAFLCQMTGTYRPFSLLTKEAFIHALEAYGIEPDDRLLAGAVEAYKTLGIYDETEEVLSRQKGVVHAVVSNGSRDMLEPLIHNSGAAPFIDEILSMDEVKQYKPSPAAYQYALRYFGVKRKEVLFVSSNTWDVIGAGTFGFDTLWLNRSGSIFETGHHHPDYTGKSLHDLENILHASQMKNSDS
jgi:2-haloacid dehalogenase